MLKKVKIALAAGFILLLGYIVFSSTQVGQVGCEVCIEFHGRTECRSAAGPTAADARMTATSNACALLAAGMTESIACGNSVPRSVSCREK